MKLSTVFWLLTGLFVLVTLAALFFYIRSGAQMSSFTVMGPAAAALICSSLAVRFRNDGK